MRNAVRELVLAALIPTPLYLVAGFAAYKHGYMFVLEVAALAIASLASILVSAFAITALSDKWD